MMQIQKWDNGKRGCFCAIDDDDYSLKFIAKDKGDNITDEDLEKSPVVASHFIGYCFTKLPKGKGNDYTKFYTYYYKERLKRFRKKHKAEIEHIGDPHKSEIAFINEHLKEESQAFKDSEVLFEFDTNKEKVFSRLYFEYRNLLRKKLPLYFVFKEDPVPAVFKWKEFDLIAASGFQTTEIYLNQVFDWSLGRVAVSSFINGGYAPKKEDEEQIKAVYGDWVKPFEVYYVLINTTDTKKLAKAIYYEFIADISERQFVNETVKKIYFTYGEQWLDKVCSLKQPSFVEAVQRQLTLRLQIITDKNENDHKPFRFITYEPLDDDAVLGLNDDDCNGYAAHPFHRLNDEDFKAMMEAFNRWAKLENNDSEEKLPTTEALESIFLNNNEVLQIFLHRIKNKKGAKIVDEVMALVELGLIDEDEKGAHLWKELNNLGYDTTSDTNWFSLLNTTRDAEKIKKIKEIYTQQSSCCLFQSRRVR